MLAEAPRPRPPDLVVAQAVLGSRFFAWVHRVVKTLHLNSVAIGTPGTESGGMPMGEWLEGPPLEAANIDLAAIGVMGRWSVVCSAV